MDLRRRAFTAASAATVEINGAAVTARKWRDFHAVSVPVWPATRHHPACVSTSSYFGYVGFRCHRRRGRRPIDSNVNRTRTLVLAVCIDEPWLSLALWFRDGVFPTAAEQLPRAVYLDTRIYSDGLVKPLRQNCFALFSSLEPKGKLHSSE